MGAQRERRTLTTALELREIDDGAGGKRRVFEGYALKFNRRSENLGGFDEILRENCLDGTDMSNVVALYNHDASYPLARSTVPSGEGSLRLTVDGIGLRFTLTPTETSYAADLERNMRAGVVNQCSFAFTVADDGQAWTYEHDIDMYHRDCGTCQSLRRRLIRIRKPLRANAPLPRRRLPMKPLDRRLRKERL